MEPDRPASLERMSVSVLMERRLARSGPWSQYQWECRSVVAGRGVAAHGPGWTLVSDDGECARYMWSGLELVLARDDCESYWFNLQNEIPYLFVICYQDEAADDESMAVQPVQVTASQDQANAHMESEGLVFSVPMPDTVIDRLERYVVAHYQPVVKNKRKRRDWAQESDDHAKARRPDRFH